MDLRARGRERRAARGARAVVLASAPLHDPLVLLEDAAPLVRFFPALFSIGISLIRRRSANVHLDEHVVLVVDLNLAAFIHRELAEMSPGPRYRYAVRDAGPPGGDRGGGRIGRLRCGVRVGRGDLGMMAFSFGVIFVLVFAGERSLAALRPKRAPGVG